MSRQARKARTTSLHEEAYRLFVEKLVERRKKTGISQRALAKALGWNQSIIAKIESVQRRLDIIELVRIADALGFEAARLVREVEYDMKQRDNA